MPFSADSQPLLSMTQAELFPPELQELPLSPRWKNGEAQLQLQRILNDAIGQTTKSRSYFREQDLIRGSLRMAQNEMDPQDLETPAVEFFLHYALKKIPFVTVGRTSYLTTPAIAEMEKNMLQLAGAEDKRHVLPLDVVNRAINKKRHEFDSPSGIPAEAFRSLLQDLDNKLDDLAQSLSPAISSAIVDLVRSHFTKGDEASTDLSNSQVILLNQRLSRSRQDAPGLVLPDKVFQEIQDIINAARPDGGISAEQVEAAMAACRSNRRVTVIEGTAGAGKSYTMETVKQAYMDCGYEVMGTALAWNAAKVLEESASLDSSVATEGMVQQMLEARASGTEYFRRPTLLIVDEAGMIGTRHMSILLEESARAQVPVKVVLTGDSLQLAPVDAGSALQSIVEFYGTTRINEIRRQRQPSHRQAVYDFSQRLAGRGLYTYVQQEAISWCRNREEQIDLVVRDYLSFRHAFPSKTSLILAYLNKDVYDINERIRLALKKAGIIHKEEIKIKVTDGKTTWENPFSVGDEVVIRSNDKHLPVYDIDPSLPVNDTSLWTKNRIGAFNRNAGRVVGIFRSLKYPGSYDMVIDLHGPRPGRVVLNTQKFRHVARPAFPVTHNFATTIHASQGQTVDNTFLIDSSYMDFRLAYVGMSRHREHVQVYLNETELHQRLYSKITNKNVSVQAERRFQRSRHRGASGEAELPIKLGQFTRAEMLQTVARAWSKDSINLTATLFERDQRLGSLGTNQKKHFNVAQAARLVPYTSNEADLVDFAPETNLAYPLLDTQKIFALPDQVKERELVLPTQVFRDNQSAGQEIALDPKALASRSSPRHVFESFRPSTSLLGKVKGLLTGGNSVGKPAVSFLAPIPTPSLPFLQPPALLGSVSPDGESFSFGSLYPADLMHEVSADCFKELKGTLWAVGRYNEPRILARDAQHQIVARYRLDGSCAVGEAFPPMLLNGTPTVTTPIVIVPGVKELMLAASHSRQKYSATPDRIPHFIWDAKGADWGAIVKSLQKSKTMITIARSQHLPEQADWALTLQKKLADLGVVTKIIPKIDPGYQLGQATAQQKAQASQAKSSPAKPTPGPGPSPAPVQAGLFK